MWLFRAEPLHAIVARLRAALAAGEATFTLRVLDPDLGRGRHAGETVEHEGASYVHRPWRAWLDLAERLGLRLLTPRAAPPPFVDVRLERLADVAAGAGAARDADVTERYGADSPFARINKAEDPGFVVDLDDAVARLALPDAPRILDLGVNRGDELALLFALHPALSITAQVTGVDHSASALAVARTRFPAARCRFLEADLADLASLALGRFDLILSFGTLQSGELDDRALLRALVQDHLAPSGALILGLPNCRYVDGEVEHGARMKNFRQAELGLLFKDVAFYRKYLQQHRRRVYITGKHEVLLTAVPATAADRLEEE
jgi:trans-aconitate methyltransferase